MNPAEYRAWLRMYNDGKWARHAERSDEALECAVDRARAQIGRRRWSWKIVAAEIMDHTYPTGTTAPDHQA